MPALSPTTPPFTPSSSSDPSAPDTLASPTPSQSQRKIDEVLSRLQKLAFESAAPPPPPAVDEGAERGTPPHSTSSRSSSLSHTGSSGSTCDTGSSSAELALGGGGRVLHVVLLAPASSPSPVLPLLASLPIPPHAAYISSSGSGSDREAWLVFLGGEVDVRRAAGVLSTGLAGGGGPGEVGRRVVVREVGGQEWEVVKGRGLRVAGGIGREVQQGYDFKAMSPVWPLSPTTTTTTPSASFSHPPNMSFPPSSFNFNPHASAPTSLPRQALSSRPTAHPPHPPSLNTSALYQPALYPAPLTSPTQNPFARSAPPPLTPPRSGETTSGGWPLAWDHFAAQAQQQQQQQGGPKQPVSFRQGDWICASPACCYHNFQRNELCIACGSPRPLPSRAHAPPPLSSTSGPRLQPGAGGQTTRGGNILTPSGRAFAGEGRMKNVSEEEANPVVLWWPDNEPLPDVGQIRPVMSAVNHPPILNTGNKGPIEHQPGDWYCQKCEYLNWRRRKVCQACFPFAEGNEDGISPTLQAERIGVLTALFTAAKCARDAGVPLNLGTVENMLGVPGSGPVGADRGAVRMSGMSGAEEEFPVFGIGRQRAFSAEADLLTPPGNRSYAPNGRLHVSPTSNNTSPNVGLGLPSYPRPAPAALPFGFRPPPPSTPIRLSFPPSSAAATPPQTHFPSPTTPSARSSPTRARTSPTQQTQQQGLEAPRVVSGSAGRSIWSEGGGVAWPDFGGVGGGRRVSPPAGASGGRGEFDRAPGGGGSAVGTGVVYGTHPRLAGIQRV